MSIRIMSLVWSTALPDSEKLVLLALADCANDDGVCWPSMRTLVDKCSKTDRTIQAAVKSLAAAGHLTRLERPGKGVLYTIHPSPEVASAPKRLPPAEASPPKRATDTPEAASDKPSRTTIPSKASPSSGRGTQLPDDFEPQLSGKSAEAVAKWPPGDFGNELDQFRDWHRAKGTASKDWQASFRTWIRNAEKFRIRHAAGRTGAGSGSRSRDGLTDAFRQMSSGRAPEHAR